MPNNARDLEPMLITSFLANADLGSAARIPNGAFRVASLPEIAIIYGLDNVNVIVVVFALRKASVIDNGVARGARGSGCAVVCASVLVGAVTVFIRVTCFACQSQRENGKE
ncbi:hypothetical protein Landi51_13784 [Colletotrichum acutatum]